jgi:hypothetical protein
LKGPASTVIDINGNVGILDNNQLRWQLIHLNDRRITFEINLYMKKNIFQKYFLFASEKLVISKVNYRQTG